MRYLFLVLVLLSCFGCCACPKQVIVLPSLYLTQAKMSREAARIRQEAREIREEARETRKEGEENAKR